MRTYNQLALTLCRTISFILIYTSILIAFNQKYGVLVNILLEGYFVNVKS